MPFSAKYGRAQERGCLSYRTSALDISVKIPQYWVF